MNLYVKYAADFSERKLIFNHIKSETWNLHSLYIMASVWIIQLPWWLKW